ncbi:MAG: extracellular solute-binding protein [Clostridiaceae bacterium]|nr:extracellular solute-binding protein [Clostridiaceae bacterium]
MKKMKRLLCLLLSLVMIMSLTVGCGKETTEDATSTPQSQDTSSPTPEPEKVVLKLGIWPEPTLTDDIAVHEGYVERFNELYPNVEVVPAHYKYATDTFVPMAEAGNCPTIFETWFTEPQKLIAGEFIADITDNLKARGWDKAMNPSIRELLSKDGRIYGTPRDGYALGIMLNVELFEEAGLVDENGYPLYPKTWDELAETAKKIKDATGQAGLCLLAKDNAGGWHWSNIAWCFGATLTIDNGDGTFTANLNSPEAIAAMNYVKDLKWKYDVLTADPLNEDWGTGFTALGTGTAAMYIAANDAVNQPTQVNGLPLDKLAMCAIPEGPGGQYSLFGGTPYVFANNATYEEIEAALNYLEIMGQAPVASDEAIAGMRAGAQNKVANGVPVIPRFPSWIDQEVLDAEAKIIEEFGNVDTNMYQSYFDATKSDGNLRMEEPGLTQDMYAEITKVLQAVIIDPDADVEALLNKANENYQSLLDQTFKK